MTDAGVCHLSHLWASRRWTRLWTECCHCDRPHPRQDFQNMSESEYFSHMMIDPQRFPSHLATDRL